MPTLADQRVFPAIFGVKACLAVIARWSYRPCVGQDKIASSLHGQGGTYFWGEEAASASAGCQNSEKFLDTLV